MKPRNEDQKLTQSQSKARKPRFRIEKLEERIAPKKQGWDNGHNPHDGGYRCPPNGKPCR